MPHGKFYCNLCDNQPCTCPKPKTTTKVDNKVGEMSDHKCPLCSATLLINKEDHVWCSRPGCEFGLWKGFNIVPWKEPENIEIGDIVMCNGNQVCEVIGTDTTIPNCDFVVRVLVSIGNTNLTGTEVGIDIPDFDYKTDYPNESIKIIVKKKKGE